MKVTTLAALLQQRALSTPQAEAYRQFDARAGAWVGVSWQEFASRVRAWQAALRADGLAPADRVALLVPNGIEHVCMDQAALSLGLVTVPMHMIDQPESLAYVLADSGARLLLVDTAAHWEALAPLESQFPGLVRVVCLEGEPPAKGKARALGPWLTAGGPGGADDAWDAGALDGQSLASIVYTSGTTGHPKGVMLTHGNVLSDVYAVLEAIAVHPSDVFLSFLPLSHTLERTAGYYLPMAAGATVVFARSVQGLMEDLLTARPTVLISVPRIYERAAVAIQDSLRGKRLSRALFEGAVSVGWRRVARAHARQPASPVDEMLWALFDPLVAARVRARFGGRLRAAVTGGAPMPENVARLFLALGIPVLQGYGMTESAPVVAVNRLDDNDPLSVGEPLPGMEVRIGENAELLVRGPNVMRGYWQRPEDTAKALTSDGWLHTGDQAQLRDGKLYIRGRIKDIIVTSTGEKIAPSDVESAILADPVFEQAMVLGEARSYLAALVVLNRSRWEQEAGSLGLSAADPASLASPAAREWALGRIARAVRALPAYARPRAVSLSLSPWTIDAGLITPTLKPKRLAIERRFAGEIAALYQGH